MATRKVIIAGGRDFKDYKLLKEKCDFYLSKAIADKDNIIIVSGTANGADKLGEQYAHERGFTVEHHPANWKTYGKRAGFLRNEEMAEVSDAVIAFWDNKSKGTASMIDIAKKRNLHLRVVTY